MNQKPIFYLQWTWILICLLFFSPLPGVAEPGDISTIAGSLDIDYNSREEPDRPTFYGDSLAATQAGLFRPRGVWVDIQNNIYIADTDNHCIRKIAPSGIITTVAGNSEAGFSGDGGLATRAQLSKPYSVCVDKHGNIYIADTGNNRIRKVDTQGIITTVAGDGSTKFVWRLGFYFTDGQPSVDTHVRDGIQATQASLGNPMGVWVDDLGNIYIADTRHHRIRMVDTDGLITTIAGKGSVLMRYGEVNVYALYSLGGYSGDGSLATEGFLNNPVAIFIDDSNNLFFADSGNHRIRKIDLNTGIITTVAGDGYGIPVYPYNPGGHIMHSGRFAGDGNPAKQASLHFPSSVVATASGHILISDSLNNRIRAILARSDILTTIVGTTHWGAGGNTPFNPEFFPGYYDVENRHREVGGFSGDGGPAILARMDGPSGLFIDQRGDLYIADTGNHRIRKIENIDISIANIIGSGNIQKADVNGDGKIDFLDFLLFIQHYDTRTGEPNFDSKFDLNSDGIIDFQDFLGFAANFGKIIDDAH